MTTKMREALEAIAEMTFDPWTNGARAGEIARQALTEPDAGEALSFAGRVIHTIELPGVIDGEALAGGVLRLCVSASPAPRAAGGVWVPLEPTEEMLRAGWNAYVADMEGGFARFAATYRAMLSAAPKSEQGEKA